MKTPSPKKATCKKTCDTCGGSGQISYFRGVSRFVMDWDECQECAGTGYIDAGEPEQSPESGASDKKPSSPQSTPHDH